MRKGVCLAARTPATFAVVRTSPFGKAWATSFDSVFGDMRTVAAATASRTVGFFAPTSTMEMPPVSSRCEKSLLLVIKPSGLLQIRGRVDVHQRLAGKSRPQRLLGHDFGVGQNAPDLEAFRGDLLLDARKELRRVSAAENLKP